MKLSETQKPWAIAVLQAAHSIKVWATGAPDPSRVDLVQQIADLKQKLASKYETSARATLQSIWKQCSVAGCFDDYNAAHALFSRHLPKSVQLDPKATGQLADESAQGGTVPA